MIEPSISIPGVSVRRVSELPKSLDDAVRVGPYSTARPGMLLRVVPGVGRFLARDGTTIEYCTEPDADDAAVEALVNGGIFGALVHQRGELPLHATTLISPARTFAIAIAGPSGAGKSTTAYELTRRGWMIVSDDLTRVTIERNIPTAWPGRARLRLLADACDAFGIDITPLAAAPNWPDKYLLELPRWEQPVALTAVIALERNDNLLATEVLGGAAAIRTLAEQTYRIHYVAALGQTRRHLELVAATASRTAIISVRGRGSVRNVADAIAGAVD